MKIDIVVLIFMMHGSRSYCLISTLFLQQGNWDIVGTDLDAEFGCIFDTSCKGCGFTGAAGAFAPVNCR